MILDTKGSIFKARDKRFVLSFSLHYAVIHMAMMNTFLEHDTNVEFTIPEMIIWNPLKIKVVITSLSFNINLTSSLI